MTAITPPPIVVGVDGTRTSGPALRWATREASVRRIPVHLVSAWNPSWDIETLGLAAASVEMHCRSVLDAATADIAAADPSVEVTSTAYIGAAARSLVEASQTADTVVVGSRHHTGLRALLLGATSLEVVAHAACPAVVVRESDRLSPSDGGVVVGVDGSAASSEAVAYAFAYASAHGVGLTVLHAFQTEYVSGVISELSAEESSVRQQQEELAVTSEAFAGWREKYPEVDVKTSVVRDEPVATLASASRSAGLVVVGSRGRGSVKGVLLGSVGRHLLHDAHCPVAVVRPRLAPQP